MKVVEEMKTKDRWFMKVYYTLQMECAKSSSDISIRNFKVPHTFPK